jgi:hypothetical protein
VPDQFGSIFTPPPTPSVRDEKISATHLPCSSPELIDFKMDNENVSRPKYTHLSPETIEVGAVPNSDVFHAKRVAKEHLV